MRTVSIFKNGNNRAIRLPRDRPLTTGKPRFAYSLTVVHFRKLRYK